MRCFVLVAALMGLTACGGELLPEETQAPVSTQEAAPAQVAAPGAQQANEESLCTGGAECYCAQFKTETTCPSASHCIWFQSRCQFAYE